MVQALLTPFSRCWRSLVGLAVLSLGAGGGAVQAQLASEAAFREVVLTGAEVPLLLGTAPDRIAAFVYDGAWTPIPMQVDERERLDLGVAFDGRGAVRCADPDGTFCFAEGGTGVTVLEYTGTDATGLETLVGPDSDPAFDRDDELVFMQRFAGRLAPAEAVPAQVDAATRTAIRLDDGGYVYLFAVPSGMVPRSPERLVQLDVDLAGGGFPQGYDFAGVATNGTESGEALGSNPEATTVETAHYRLGFSDRWIHDDLRLKRNGTLGPNLLDRAKVVLELGSCNRTEWTASANRGTIVTLRDGPVRAIRVVRGFNSGPLTTGTYVFYERHAAFTTDLRVHPIPGIVDFYDYSDAALGMRYADAVQPNAPLVVDGRPDGVEPAELDVATLFWSVLSGEPGALVHAYRLDTDWDRVPFERYWDEGSTTRQCTGDDRAIGASGVLIDGRVPATDPRRDEFVPLRATRVVYYSAEPLTASEAASIAAASLPGDVGEVSEGSLGDDAPTRGAAIEALFPSVATGGAVQIQLALYEAAPYDVAAYDGLGRRVFARRLVPDSPQRLSFSIPTAGLAAGPYWLRVQSEASGLAVSRRLTVLR